MLSVAIVSIRPSVVAFADLSVSVWMILTSFDQNYDRGAKAAQRLPLMLGLTFEL
jgi:hypothetical protein